jgi:allantoate deiminase
MTSTTTDRSPLMVARLVEELARFTAPGPGVTRLVYDEAWCEAQQWMGAQAEARGLAVARDRAGNLFAHDAAVAPGQPVFLTGSHLDTVREGGPLDGAYGALAGMLLAASLRGATQPPVVGLVTCEEEGSRFSGGFLGARPLVGRVTAGEPDSARDHAGVTWAAALRAAANLGLAAHGGVGAEPTTPFPITGFLELHIEQGPVLEAEKLELGIVDRIAGYRRVRATYTGEARHAGTTPMALRRDALAAGAELALAAERIAREQGEPAVATCGAALAKPGLFNVIPGRCEMHLDMRHVESGSLERLVGAIESEAHQIATRRGLGIAWQIVSQQDPIPMDPRCVAAAQALANAHGVPHRVMASGAGHDAMIFAGAGIPALMLFVPSKGGISHHPDELTSPKQLAGGIEFAHELLPRLTAIVAGKPA